MVTVKFVDNTFGLANKIRLKNIRIRNMYDTQEKIDGALVHHGKTHNRLYLMQTEQDNWDSLIPLMKDLAQEKNYDKILGRIPEEAMELFQSNGYHVEAKIPGLYNGETTGYFLADYLNEERGHCSEHEQRTIESVKTIAQAANSASEDSFFALPENLEVRKLDRNDLFALIHLHIKAADSFAFPNHEAEYIMELVEQNHEFYGLFNRKELLVSAILKVHEEESNLEIVDFTTHPDYSGRNLSYYLVQEIRKNFDEMDCKTMYSLVRATSYGLNITFSKHDFVLGGTLLNNTLIRDTIESMNVWYYN